MGSENSAAPTHPVCLLDALNSHHCTEENPVVSYLKRLDEDQGLLQEQSRDFDTDRFRKIGDELVSKAVLSETVRDGKCFQVVNPRGAVRSNSLDEAANWICDDDLEDYWRQNCILLNPAITTCMDETAILKHTGDAENLKLSLLRQKAKLL